MRKIYNLHYKCNLFNKLANKYSVASDVIDLKSVRDKKEKEKGSKALISIFETMDVNTLFSKDSITVDLMHEARKKAGFPPPPTGSPPWLIILLSILDIEDPQKRNYLYKQQTFTGLFSNINSKDINKKNEAIKYFESEKEAEAINFIEKCKANKIKFFNLKKWILDYPALFNRNYLAEDLVRRATEVLKYKNKIKVLKELKALSFTKEDDPKNMPIGTVLYNIYLGEENKHIKEENNFWKNEQTGLYGNDNFIKSILTYSDEYEPDVFAKPKQYFINKVSDFEPNKSLIVQEIDDMLLQNPEKILSRDSWITEELNDEYYSLPHLNGIDILKP
jgi:hypothetical protein